MSRFLEKHIKALCKKYGIEYSPTVYSIATNAFNKGIYESYEEAIKTLAAERSS